MSQAIPVQLVAVQLVVTQLIAVHLPPVFLTLAYLTALGLTLANLPPRRVMTARLFSPDLPCSHSIARMMLAAPGLTACCLNCRRYAE